MDSVLWVFVDCLVLGALVGFLAGLLGIGGGLLVVPALIYLLPSVGINAEQLPHIAIATSLAAIILTSSSSARAHYNRGNIPWALFKPMMPGIIVGALAAAFISEQIPAHRLQQGFALFVLLMSAQMAFPRKAEAGRSLPGTWVLFWVSVSIALLAGMMGIGGGVLLVPFLTWCGLQMRHAVGFSAMTGLLISLVGSLGYVLAGADVPGLPQWTLGFIYLPALLGIVLTSMLMAPVGVRAASHWPTLVLKRIFAVLLFSLGLKLILT
ncbi:sulfite exporter TauE/SafE family protein [Shewanella salipaludis]|uniref:Probable membrane transporter protein n=1 Tax=Shewanella salipaludis TaxID=2723052 RepID=A0A972FX01_9GAMM|nr:sulfite exporter TauE/SafE family protein [Shewanella salipaludis]NMH64798.1 sulfite exporter TauE/SafE family protein [Shewanella salipaludis]